MNKENSEFFNATNYLLFLLYKLQDHLSYPLLLWNASFVYLYIISLNVNEDKSFLKTLNQLTDEKNIL